MRNTSLSMERSLLAALSGHTCWPVRSVAAALPHAPRRRPLHARRALPVDKDQDLMSFLTAEGKSFDDLELDDDYYK